MTHHCNFIDDPAAYLQRLLPSDYIRPYGTDSTPESFIPIDEQTVRVTIAAAQGAEEQYTLDVAPDQDASGRQIATCRDAGGKPVTYQDPYTFRETKKALVEAWYDFLLAKDATARRTAVEGGEIWEQDDVEGQLYRIQRGLVAFGEESTHTANFANTLELYEWTNKVIEGSPISFVVGAITDIEQFQQATEGALKCMNFTSDEGGKLYTRPIPESLNPTAGRPESLHDLGTDVPCVIDFDFEVDGPTFERFHGDFMTLYSHVAETLSNSDTRPDWFYISPGTLNAVMPVPSDGTVLTVQHDGDGSKIMVELTCEAHAARQNRLEEQYQRRWGRWLDDNVALSEEELESGVTAIEAQLDTLRVREAVGEVMHGSAH